jgi:hypothetical protein
MRFSLFTKKRRDLLHNDYGKPCWHRLEPFPFACSDPDGICFNGLAAFVGREDPALPVLVAIHDHSGCRCAKNADSVPAVHFPTPAQDSDKQHLADAAGMLLEQPAGAHTAADRLRRHASW